jgi:hypothetical protein
MPATHKVQLPGPRAALGATEKVPGAQEKHEVPRKKAE